ncbi:MAG: hypothetical protein IPK72_08490 [Candidatus Eisenbacteria bacterium]|nr:hypothetical protein [Candidatus Eisenbacteria bacterium]
MLRLTGHEWRAFTVDHGYDGFGNDGALVEWGDDPILLLNEIGKFRMNQDGTAEAVSFELRSPLPSMEVFVRFTPVEGSSVVLNGWPMGVWISVGEPDVNRDVQFEILGAAGAGRVLIDVQQWTGIHWTNVAVGMNLTVEQPNSTSVLGVAEEVE